MRISLKSGRLFTIAAALLGTLALAPCRADDIQVNVAIDKMTCIKPSDTGLNNRDEVYIVVKTKSPTVEGAKRLPRPDDYYEFWKGTQGEVRGWTNRDQLKQGDPILFRGNLAPGQSAHLLVAIGEQDNADLPEIGRMILKISELAVTVISDAFGVPEVGKAVNSVLKDMSGLIKDNHDDQIGSFGLVLKNENGKLSEIWVPGNFTSKQTDDGTFQCQGTSNSAYNLHVKVDQKSVAPGTPLPTRRVFLGTTFDQCGEPTLSVQGAQGTVEIRKGETKEIHVAANRFFWTSSNSKEATTGPQTTNLVIATRSAEDRKITWKCYREE